MPKEKADSTYHAFQVRVKIKLWNAFTQMCIDNCAKPGEVVRDVMRAMVRENNLARQNNTFISFEEAARRKQIELRETVPRNDAE